MLMAKFLKSILKESNLDGVKYIILERLHLVERIFWSITVLAMIGLAIYQFFDLYLKLITSPFIISFQPQETSVSDIPFPAITICNVNMFKVQMMTEVLDILRQEIFTPGYEQRKRFQANIAIIEHVAQYCLAAPSFRRSLGERLVDAEGNDDFIDGLQWYLEHFKKNDTLDSDYMLGETFSREIEAFRKKASHNCEDMILHCMWERESLPCHELFFRIHTQQGSCCVFNMMPLYILKKIPESDSRFADEKQHLPAEAISDWEHFSISDLVHPSDKFSNYPRRQRTGGMPYGLSVILNPELEMYSTCTTSDAWGFKVLAHSPLSFPSIMNYGEAVPPSGEVFMEIEPDVSIADENILGIIDVEKRNCYLPSDPQANLDHYKFYSSSNCMDECTAKYTYSKCSCMRHFMPRNSSQKLCGAKKLGCAEKVRENIMYAGKMGSCSKCKPACTDIKYKMRATHFPTRKGAVDSDFEYLSKNGTKQSVSNYSIVHIYMGGDSFYAKERKGLYDSSVLLSHAGGVLGLTLGFSLTSLMEIVYFFTLKVTVHVLSLRKNSKIKSARRKLLM